jgi:hypothetical protein
VLVLATAAALWVLDPWRDIFALVLAVLLWRPAADLTRLVFAPPAARRHYPGMVLLQACQPT